MVFEVSKIDDIALSLTFELYFDLRWRETRLIINDRDDGRRESESHNALEINCQVDKEQAQHNKAHFSFNVSIWMQPTYGNQLCL